MSTNKCSDQKKKSDWLDKKQEPAICCLQESLQGERHIEMESYEIENNTSCKWKWQEGRNSNTCIRQNRLQSKGHKERQRRALYNDKGINTRRGYYTY